MNFKTKQVIDVYPSLHKIDLINRLSKVPMDERKKSKIRYN